MRIAVAALAVAVLALAIVVVVQQRRLNLVDAACQGVVAQLDLTDWVAVCR